MSTGDETTTAARDRDFDRLVAEQRDRSVAMAWRLLGGDRAAAEDVVQEAFLRAYDNLDRFRGDARLSTWFYRILMNEVQRYRRWSWVRVKRAVEPDDEAPDPAARPMGDPALRARIESALGRLSAGQREAFVLVHLEGFTVREAAEITGRADGTLKSHLHRALARLRDELGDIARERDLE